MLAIRAFRAMLLVIIGVCFILVGWKLETEACHMALASKQLWFVGALGCTSAFLVLFIGSTSIVHAVWGVVESRRKECSGECGKCAGFLMALTAIAFVLAVYTPDLVKIVGTPKGLMYATQIIVSLVTGGTILLGGYYASKYINSMN